MSGKKVTPEMVILNKPVEAVGLAMKTSMKSVFKDVSKILKTNT